MWAGCNARVAGQTPISEGTYEKAAAGADGRGGTGASHRLRQTSRACSTARGLGRARRKSRFALRSVRAGAASSGKLITESMLLSPCRRHHRRGGLAILMVKGLLAFPAPRNISGYTISSAPDYRMLAFTLAILSPHRPAVRSGFPALQANTARRPPARFKDEAASVAGGGGQISFRKSAGGVCRSTLSSGFC